ncbi:hypothetical protein [Xanthomonas bromi]|nr:hypothetical protein [Xanthomonas bromi]
MASWLAGLRCESTGIVHFLSPGKRTHKPYPMPRIGRKAMVIR